MAKPTPGPWKKIYKYDNSIYILGADEKVYVATIETGAKRHAYEAPGESAEANASLIEAAPELLKALEKAQTLVKMAYQCPEWLTGYRSSESDDAVEQIESAIRKAKESA